MRSRQSFIVVPLAAVLAALAVPAGAGEPSPQKCEQAIVRAAGSFFIQHTAVVRKCEKRRAQGLLGPTVSCTDDQPMAGELALLAEDLERVIGKACGGADRACGTPDDLALTETGWGQVEACPDIDGSGCTGPIDNCGDIAACVQCAGAAASEQTREVVAGAFQAAEFGTESEANDCQVALLRGSTKFMQLATKALGKCWTARLRGKVEGECPEDDEDTAKLIARAEEKKLRHICKACGGDDKQCGGGDDVEPSAIGFAASCPDLSVPSGTSCGGAILGLEDVVDCVDCVAAFKAECVTRLATPGAAVYPPACNPNGNGLCGNGVLDPGEECDPGAGSPDGAFDGSPGGAFCPDMQTCTAACVCDDGTTSTTITKTTTTTTTTGPHEDECGNGRLDTGEECDPSSKDSCKDDLKACKDAHEDCDDDEKTCKLEYKKCRKAAEKCEPECDCDPQTCQCVDGSTTTTTSPSPTTTTSPSATTSTTTTLPGSPSGAFL